MRFAVPDAFRETMKFACTAASLLLGLTFVACGGKIASEISGGGETSADGGTTGRVPVDASQCIDVDLASYSQSCNEDSDCILVSVGEICSGQCMCGDTPINIDGEGRYAAQTSTLSLDACPCAFPGNARCLASTCVLCGFGPDEPAGCADGGSTFEDDAGNGSSDGGNDLTDGGTSGIDSGLEEPDAAEGPDAGSDGLDGIWTGSWQTVGGGATELGTLTMQLSVQGSVVSGPASFAGEPCFAAAELNATVAAGDGFYGTVVEGASTADVKVQITGDVMTGSFSIFAGQCLGFEGTFNATR
jgi:hypothetical protein